MKTVRDIFHFINSLDLSENYEDSNEFITANPVVTQYLKNFLCSRRKQSFCGVGLKIDDIYIGLFFGEHGVLISFEDVLMEFDIDGKILFENDLVMKWLSMSNMKFMDLTFDDLKILKMECDINGQFG